MGRWIVPALLGLALAAGLAAGFEPFVVAVVLLSGVVAADLCSLLRRGGQRPLVVVALLAAVGAPLVVALDPTTGWERLPVLFAGVLLLSFVLLLVFGRRRGVADGTGATLLAALLVGLGSGSLLLLRSLPDGLVWLLLFAGLVVSADMASAGLRLLRSRAAERDTDGPAPWLAGAVANVGAPALAVAAVAAGAVVALGPPLQPLVALLLALVALTASVAGTELHGLLSVDAGAGTGSAAQPGAGGLLLGMADAALLGAPAAYVLVTSPALTS